MSIITRSTTILSPRKRPSLAGAIIFILFGGLAAMVSSAASESPQVKSSLKADDSVTGRSRVTLNGVEYIKINLGELYQLCLDAKSDKIADHYVARGIVRRTPELDTLGQFALIRTAVPCCHAHAAPVGFRVDYNQSSEIRDGQWVEVYGTLKKLSPDLPNPNLHSIGIPFVRLNKSRCIIPTRIVKIPQPEDPDILEFRSAEPYAY